MSWADQQYIKFPYVKFQNLQPQNGVATNGISIGKNAGYSNQGTNAIAIGNNTGQGTTSGQGANSICIGNNAGVASATAGSICLNATGNALNPNQAGFFVNPVRTTTASVDNVVTYNSNELTSIEMANAFPYFSYNNMLGIYGYKWGSFDVTTNAVPIVNPTIAVTVGNTYFQNYWLPKGLVITNFGVWWNTINVIDVAGWRFGIYSTSGVNPALLASTGILASAVPQAPTSYPLSAVFTVPSSGIYSIAFYVASTARILSYNGNSGNGNINLGLTPTLNRLNGYSNGTVASGSLTATFSGTLSAYLLRHCFYFT